MFLSRGRVRFLGVVSMVFRLDDMNGFISMLGVSVVF